MWHCSTTAYPACHEDRGERNSLFDSGPSGRLWHVAPKIHHWTNTQAHISSNSGIVYGIFWDISTYVSVIKTSHHGGTQGDLFVKKMKVAMDTTQKWLNPDMDRPRLKKSVYKESIHCQRYSRPSHTSILIPVLTLDMPIVPSSFHTCTIDLHDPKPTRVMTCFLVLVFCHLLLNILLARFAGMACGIRVWHRRSGGAGEEDK